MLARVKRTSWTLRFTWDAWRGERREKGERNKHDKIFIFVWFFIEFNRPKLLTIVEEQHISILLVLSFRSRVRTGHSFNEKKKEKITTSAKTRFLFVARKIVWFNYSGSTCMSNRCSLAAEAHVLFGVNRDVQVWRCSILFKNDWYNTDKVGR